MSLAKRISDLEAALMEARFEIVELRRRVRDMIRVGRVKKVDPKTGTMDVVDEPEGGNDNERLEWFGVPWAEPGANPQGGLQTWHPPRENAQVLMLNMDGLPRAGIGLLAAFSDDAPAPSQDPDTRVAKIGDLTVRQKGESYFVMLGQDKDMVHVELSKERVRGRHGDARYVAKPGKYAKIRRGDSFVVCTGKEVRIRPFPPVNLPDIDDD